MSHEKTVAVLNLRHLKFFTDFVLTDQNVQTDYSSYILSGLWAVQCGYVFILGQSRNHLLLT